MRSLHQEYLTPCRKIALESAGKVHPAIVAILTENYAKADANYAKFVTRKITWGEFVTENQALVNQRRARLLAQAGSRKASVSHTHPSWPPAPGTAAT
jgi:hypothetical protein